MARALLENFNGLAGNTCVPYNLGLGFVSRKLAKIELILNYKTINSVSYVESVKIRLENL